MLHETPRNTAWKLSGKLLPCARPISTLGLRKSQKLSRTHEGARTPQVNTGLLPHGSIFPPRITAGAPNRGSHVTAALIYSYLYVNTRICTKLCHTQVPNSFSYSQLTSSSSSALCTYLIFLSLYSPTDFPTQSHLPSPPHARYSLCLPLPTFGNGQTNPQNQMHTRCQVLAQSRPRTPACSMYAWQKPTRDRRQSILYRQGPLFNRKRAQGSISEETPHLRSGKNRSLKSRTEQPASVDQDAPTPGKSPITPARSARRSVQSPTKPGKRPPSGAGTSTSLK